MSRVLRISLAAFLLAGVGTALGPRWILLAAGERVRQLGRWLNDNSPRRRRTALACIWVVAMVPMLHLTYLVRLYGVEVPKLDDWEMAPLIVDAHHGALRWADIFAQQQEARTILPKLIFILSAAGDHWDVRDQMLISVAACWLTAAGLFVLLRRSQLGLGALAVCFWLVVLTIFTLAKYEIWTFASGFPSFFPALFLTTALVVAGTRRLATPWKFILCALLAASSSFTLANGLLAWGLTFPACLLMNKIPRWRSWLVGWLGLCALCVTVYFWGYRKPADLTAFAPAVAWTSYARFILEFLGGALAYAWKSRPNLMAALFGLVQLAFFAGALFYCLRRIRDRSFLARAVPWFALALHSVGSAVLAALGRVGYGAPYALASRYVTFSVYLIVAVIALIALLVSENGRENPALPGRLRWSSAICFLLLAAYLIPYKVCAANSRFFARAASAKDRLARAAILFSPALDASELIKKTNYPNDARPVISGADHLDRLHLLRPALVRTNRLDALPHAEADGRLASGLCESVTSGDANLIRASGWAALNEKGRPPDCVAVGYQAEGEEGWRLCALSNSFSMRPEIVKRLRSMEQLWSGWSVTLPREAFPAGAKLSFWAVDADGPKLYRLEEQTAGLR
jgi:hypothetical protein